MLIFIVAFFVIVIGISLNIGYIFEFMRVKSYLLSKTLFQFLLGVSMLYYFIISCFIFCIINQLVIHMFN